MAKLRGLVIAAGAAIASYGWANAADLLPPPPPLPPAPVPEFGGWYLRGDLGFGVAAGVPQLKNTPDPIATGVSSGFLSSLAYQSFYNTTLSSSGMIDFGVGYQFNNWFRVDGTLEYRTGAHLQSLYALTDPAQSDFRRFDPIRRLLSRRRLVVHRSRQRLRQPRKLVRRIPLCRRRPWLCRKQRQRLHRPGLRLCPYWRARIVRRLLLQRLEDPLRLGADGGPRFQHQPKPQAGTGLPLSQLRLDHSGGSNCLAGAAGGTFTNQNCSGGVTNYVSSRNTLASNDFRIGLIYLLGGPVYLPPAPIVTKY